MERNDITVERFNLAQIRRTVKAPIICVYNSPAGIPSIACPSLGNGTVLLTDPKNLIVVNTYSVKIRKTVEGKEAIMQDKRFYVVHLDFDPIIEELDATAIIKGLK